ncbi:retron St85 family effector protein [Tunturiibacter psychrotolerans]|uniref:retron St85 family effector protein n=1 Tax=Tunturiibacter psychrotolerans TaxID=3069686 RepID=UPI003D25179B
MSTFTDSVEPNAFTIQNQPDYIFLCGGPLTDLKHSLRAHFFEEKAKKDPTLLKRIQLAENADLWYQSRKLFDDLLELEQYLAGLSACILLFVESPGAIAEFGAFSQMALLQDKLVVVIEDSYSGQQSFINHGLVAHLKQIRPDSVLSYPWLSFAGSDRGEIDLVTAKDTLDEVETTLRSLLAKKPKKTLFQSGDHGHLMLLIADLVILNVVILQHEIQTLLTDLGLQVMPQDLKKYLFLLEQLQLITPFRYGNVDYYINSTGSPEYVSYASKNPTDRLRLRALLRQDLPLTPEKSKALKAFTKRPTGGVR